MAKKSAASAKPAKKPEDKKAPVKNPASRGVTGKSPKDEPHEMSNLEKRKAAQMRRKRILVAVVSTLLVIAFCVPSAIYLISGARKDAGKTEQQVEDTAAQYAEQIASLKAELETDATATDNYKKIAALYAQWAADVTDGTIADSNTSADELFTSAVDSYENYFSNDPEPSSNSYRSLASVYSEWGDALASGSITESSHSCDELYSSSVDAYNTYFSKSGKTNAFSKIADVYTNWATKVGQGTISSDYSCDDLFNKAIAAYESLMANGGDADTYLTIASVYQNWANGVEYGTLVNSSSSASQLWSRCAAAYGSYLDAASDQAGSDTYLNAIVGQADALASAGDTSAAISKLEALTADQPTYLSGWASLAYVYQDMDDNDNAKKVYENMIAANEDNPTAYYYYGYFLSTIDDIEGAKEAYQKALDVDPDDEYGLASTIQMMMSSLEPDDEEADADSEDSKSSKKSSKKSSE